MLAFSLGLAWLVLGPFSLWVLVSGRAWARAGAVLALTMLEVATIATNAVRFPLPDPHGGAVAARPEARAECAEREPLPRTGRVEGRRGGLVLSWPAAAGECATADVVLRAEGRRLRVWLHEGPAPGSAPGSAAPGASGDAGSVGAGGTRGSHGASGSVSGAPGSKGAGSGGAGSGGAGGRSVPVRVEEGEASLRVPLTAAGVRPAQGSGDAGHGHGHLGRYVLIDGRTGHRIPAPDGSDDLNAPDAATTHGSSRPHDAPDASKAPGVDHRRAT
ncbi:hypothetical protein ACIBG4_27565 [Nonomuraea sp. NPDC050383]|uniref:hypothetical protein n=1 Tax=Nonomuraea sp. NPDC050383 TaxID=3364362 RepID=UPI0037A200E2